MASALRPLMLSLWEAQGKCCAVCGVKMIPKTLARWTIEHVYPRSRYFLYGDGNQLVSHYECNQRKAARDPTGCEIILLHAANAKLALEITEKPRSYVDPYNGPTALAVALEKAMAA